MDTSQTPELVKWVIGVGVSSIIAIILGLISIYKAGKMLPKELAKAELENKEKEGHLAEQYDKIATLSTERALKTQERLSKLESDIATMICETNTLKQKVADQEVIMAEQALIIEAQSERLNLQAEKLSQQESEIAALVCELNNYKLYTNALISQMQDAKIVPLEMKTLPTEDCEKKRKKINGKTASVPKTDE